MASGNPAAPASNSVLPDARTVAQTSANQSMAPAWATPNGLSMPAWTGISPTTWSGEIFVIENSIWPVTFIALLLLHVTLKLHHHSKPRAPNKVTRSTPGVSVYEIGRAHV